MIELNEATFPQEVSSSGLVLVDFWGPRCGPCRALAPIFEQVAGEITDVKFAKVNIDDAPDLFEKHKVNGIPCIIVFKDGTEVGRLIGLQSADNIKEAIDGFR